mmetsp:Transcript_69314/g.137442  ORF Transcript_69314/g.137442 Transcript_69314/m.137442 type:complete len:345 (-) Transcript_69314:195-1229(-)
MSAECTFRWFPYKADRKMGLNHQMSSLSCAMNEAAYLGRTLLLPQEICTDGSHNTGEACATFESLFDLHLINAVVSARLQDGETPEVTTIRGGCDSHCAKDDYPCSNHRHLRRRQPGFWFQPCLRGAVETSFLSQRVQVLLRAPHAFTAETMPSLALLRSGLFYSRELKALARVIRRRIGGSYSAVHLRRSDKLRAPFCHPAECRARNHSTQPAALLRMLRHWVPPTAPPSSTLYIGTTEPPSFFEPLASTYHLLFASNFSEELRGVRNNYALYAVESLLFVGADLYVETFGYSRGNFMRGCFPFGTPHRHTHGVTYGRACSRECHEDLHLLPPSPQRCRRSGS